MFESYYHYRSIKAGSDAQPKTLKALFICLGVVQRGGNVAFLQIPSFMPCEMLYFIFRGAHSKHTTFFYLYTHSRRRSYKLNKQIAWICSYYATVIKWKLSNHFTMRWQLLEFTDCYHIYITECGRVTASLTNWDFQHCQTIERNKTNNEMTWACLSGIILYLFYEEWDGNEN